MKAIIRARVSTKKEEDGYEAGGAILSDTLEKIEKAFKAEGVVFIDEDEQLGPGVRLPREAKSTAAPKLSLNR